MVSRLAWPISGSPYFDATTSPCSVMRMPCAEASAGQGPDGVEAGAAAAPHRAAAAMEEAHADAALLAQRHQPGDAGIDFPVGGDVAAILVAVGIADHHFLQIALAGDHGAHQRGIEIGAHHRGAVAQILDGLEQRHDAQPRLRCLGPGRNRPGFLHQQRGFQQVGRRCAALEITYWATAPSPKVCFQRRGLVGNGQFARRLGRIVGIGRAQGPGMGQFAQQQRGALRLRPAPGNRRPRPPLSAVRPRRVHAHRCSGAHPWWRGESRRRPPLRADSAAALPPDRASPFSASEAAMMSRSAAKSSGVA